VPRRPARTARRALLRSIHKAPRARRAPVHADGPRRDRPRRRVFAAVDPPERRGHRRTGGRVLVRHRAGRPQHVSHRVRSGGARALQRTPDDGRRRVPRHREPDGGKHAARRRSFGRLAGGDGARHGHGERRVSRLQHRPRSGRHGEQRRPRRRRGLRGQRSRRRRHQQQLRLAGDRRRHAVPRRRRQPLRAFRHPHSRGVRGSGLRRPGRGRHRTQLSRLGADRSGSGRHAPLAVWHGVDGDGVERRHPEDRSRRRRQRLQHALRPTELPARAEHGIVRRCMARLGRRVGGRGLRRRSGRRRHPHLPVAGGRERRRRKRRRRGMGASGRHQRGSPAGGRHLRAHGGGEPGGGGSRVRVRERDGLQRHCRREHQRFDRHLRRRDVRRRRRMGWTDRGGHAQRRGPGRSGELVGHWVGQPVDQRSRQRVHQRSRQWVDPRRRQRVDPRSRRRELGKRGLRRKRQQRREHGQPAGPRELGRRGQRRLVGIEPRSRRSGHRRRVARRQRRPRRPHPPRVRVRRRRWLVSRRPARGSGPGRSRVDPGVALAPMESGRSRRAASVATGESRSTHPSRYPCRRLLEAWCPSRRRNSAAKRRRW
jgi:hypothetical protein